MQQKQKKDCCQDKTVELKGVIWLPNKKKVNHEPIRWSNAIVDSPVVYGLIERRTLYFITGEVKHKFAEKNLDVPENWKDLYFHLTEEDLGLIGGMKNIPSTYEALNKLGEKFLPVAFKNEKGELVVGKVHWIDTFFYNTKTGLYDVRVSPEIMPYLIDISRNFTTFDLGTAMLLRSKYTQKMYELCNQFSGNFRYSDQSEKDSGVVYKKRVLPIQIADFRRIFNLDEVIDPRTKKVITPASYTNFKSIRENILDVAQKELYELYACHQSNIWFDYKEGPRKGRGGRVSSVYIFIYTRDYPKEGNGQPWKKGDEPLSPFEIYVEPQKHLTPYQRIRQSHWYKADMPSQEQIVEVLLRRYLHEYEVKYYLRQLSFMARKHADTYMQVIQVIEDKEKQPKFKNGTPAYKHNNIIYYVQKENLKVFGWSLEPMSSKKKPSRTIEQDLFGK
jgi:hypothetical protein